MRKGKKLAAVLLSAAMVMTSLSLPGGKTAVGAAETVEVTETTETDGFRSIDAATITEEMGAGWNLGNQMESVNSWSGSVAFPDETAYGNPVVKKELIDTVKEQGFKSVRIPVSYLTMIGSEKEGYKIDEDWLNRLEEIVGYVIENDMYAIINMHGDGYSTVKGGWILPGLGDNQQEIIKAKYKACWEQIAERFKNQNEKLIFESMNEVGADASESSKAEVTAYYKNINAYNQIFVDTVRQSGGNNDKRWLLIPGINTNAALTTEEAGFVLPTDQYRSDTIPEKEQRIMVSVHYYAPWTFCGQEDYMTTQWGMESTDDSRAATEGLELDMEQVFAGLYDEFVKRGYPVVIGEYGCVDKSQIKAEDVTSGKFNPDDVDANNNEYRAYYTEVLNMLAKRYSCIPVYWDNGYNGAFGMGIFDRITYKVTQPEILRAIMKIYTASSRNVRELKLDQTSLRLYLGDEGTKLTATVTPKASEGNIIWESADPTIAAVSQRGTVVPKDVGTTVITASVGGKREYCIVHVSPAQRFRAKLYYNSVSGGWSYATLASKDYVSVEAGQGGTYTLKLTGPQERMMNINTLYLKDVLGNDGKIENSLISKATIKIDSLKMNEFEATMTKDEFVFDASEKGSNGIFDICLLNVWDESYAQEFKPNAGSGGSFPESAYVEGTNTITLTFTLSDVEQSNDNMEEIEPTSLTLVKESVDLVAGAEMELMAQLEPDNTTYQAVWVSDDPSIARVTSTGKVTGVTEGTVTLHAFTGNGLEKTCTVNVVGGAEGIAVLQSAVTQAEELNREDYTETSYGKLEEVLQEAKELLNTAVPDSSEIARVQSALEDAVNHLLKKDTYDSVMELLNNELPKENYTEKSWARYQKQIRAIQKQMAEETLTQQELEGILQSFDTIRKGLLTQKTQDEMAAGIEEAKKYQSAEYTAESWKELEDALNAAENAYQDVSVGEEQMQQLLTALQTAVNGLQKAGASEQNPGTSQPSAGTSNPGTSNSGTVSQPPAGTKAPAQGTSVSASKVLGKKMTLSKVKSPKKKTIQIIWKKLAGASGYQIKLATNKKMTKGKKTVVVKKASTTKKKVKNLKAGKKYYVRIRAYETVSGKKVYSKWSAVKSVKVKK